MSTSSDKFGLEFGVLKGSVLGSLFFVLYLSSIGDIIRKHSINYNIYADDILLYMAFDSKIDGAAELALSKLLLCIKGALVKLTSSPNFFPKSWDFYTIRSVGMGNDCMLSFTF